MSKVEDGGPAFPRHFNYAKHGGGGVITSQDGMSLRDYFAGQALAGWLASFPVDAAVKSKNVAEFAYEIADAMLAARQGQGGGS